MTIKHKPLKSPIRMVNQQSPTLKLSAAIVNFSVVGYAKVALAAAKTFDQFSLEEVFSIHDIFVSCLQIDVAAYSYSNTSLKTDTKDNRGVREYAHFTCTTILPLGYLKDFLINLNNKKCREQLIDRENAQS